MSYTTEAFVQILYFYYMLIHNRYYERQLEKSGRKGIMRKIVFFDVDGTLLDHEKNLPQSAKKAVQQLQANGIYTAIATGRAPFMIQSIIEELNINSYVCFNGQYVVFENNVIHKNPLKKEDLMKLEKDALAHNHPIVYMTVNDLKANVPFDERIKEGLGTLLLDHPPYEPGYYEQKEVFQALLFARKDEVSYTRKYEDRHTFIRWHEVSMDVIPKGGSKAEGIKKIIDYLQIPMENVYAFGDALNDIEMLETVGTGIAMGNALEEVKKHADFVTADVDDNGIWKGLKHFGLL